jgi:hypothetical protein
MAVLTEIYDVYLSASIWIPCQYINTMTAAH